MAMVEKWNSNKNFKMTVVSLRNAEFAQYFEMTVVSLSLVCECLFPWKTGHKPISSRYGSVQKKLVNRGSIQKTVQKTV